MIINYKEFVKLYDNIFKNYSSTSTITAFFSLGEVKNYFLRTQVIIDIKSIQVAISDEKNGKGFVCEIINDNRTLNSIIKFFEAKKIKYTYETELKTLIKKD